MILLQTAAGFGNQMWQYASARFYAQRHGLAFRLHRHDGCDAHHSGAASQLLEMFDLPLSLRGRKLRWRWRIERGLPKRYGTLISGQLTPANEQPPESVLRLSGNFENVAQLPDVPTLRQWFALNRPVAPQPGTAIHVRLGDKIGLCFGGDLSPVRDYLHTVLRQDLPGPRLLFTDSAEHPLIREIQTAYDLTIQDCGWQQAWRAIYAATNVVQVQSTFSWWAAHIGHAERIWMPSRSHPANAHLLVDTELMRGLDHWPIGDDRYRMVDAVATRAELASATH